MKIYAHVARIALFLSAFATGCDSAQETNEWPTLPIGIQPGTRLRPKLLLADDGTIMVHPTIWIDSEYGECVFRTATDGKWRCLPNELHHAIATYLDPSCIQEVFVYRPNSECSTAGVRVLVQDAEPTICSAGTTRVMTTGKAVAVTSLFALYDGVCAPTLPPDPSENASVFLLETEIPAGEFVSAWSGQ